MYAGLLLPMTLKINPVPARKTPRGIINKPLLSFLAMLMILSFKSVNFSISDNTDNHSEFSRSGRKTLFRHNNSDAPNLIGKASSGLNQTRLPS